MSILQSNESHITINADGASKEVRFQNNGTQNMVLDSSGNVGIGTASPSGQLHVSGGASNANFYLSNSSYSSYYYQNTGGSSGVNFPASQAYLWETGGTERMRIDSSGNLLVGKTSVLNSVTTVGFHAQPSGVAVITRDGSAPLRLARKTSDGEILSFHKDGTTVGNISNRGSLLQIHSDSGAGIDFGGSQLNPLSGSSLTDASIDIGQPSFRFNDLYLSGGVYVGGTGSANYLDDYEEGTFTPTLLGSTSNPSYTGGYQGKYIKIGKIVHFSLYVDTNPYSTDGSGSIRVGGLPFIVNADNGGWAPAIPVSIYGPSIGSGKHINARPTDNQSYLEFRIWGDNVGQTAWTFSTASWSSGDAIYIQGHYFTD